MDVIDTMKYISNGNRIMYHEESVLNDSIKRNISDIALKSIKNAGTYAKINNKMSDNITSTHYSHAIASYKQTNSKSNTNNTKFWIYDPSILFQTYDIIPTDNMCNVNRMNALTRVIILISLVMFIIKFPLWWLFLLLGIFIIIFFWCILDIDHDSNNLTMLNNNLNTSNDKIVVLTSDNNLNTSNDKIVVLTSDIANITRTKESTQQNSYNDDITKDFRNANINYHMKRPIIIHEEDKLAKYNNSDDYMLNIISRR